MKGAQAGSGRARGRVPSPTASGGVVIATILPPSGSTGVHTHVRQLAAYLASEAIPTTVVTPFDWGGPLAIPAFGPRRAIEAISPSASVAWYRHWHDRFLRAALRERLADRGQTVIYAQCPVAARAALETRQGPHQRVVLAVHFQVSQADEWVHKGLIPRDGATFRGIRKLEEDVLARVDGIVYVSKSAREDLLTWHDDVSCPWAVVPNFVAAVDAPSPAEPVADLVTVGGLELAKNHRYLLDVLAAARDAGAVLTLDIFGKGTCHRDLLRQVDRLGLGEQVRLRGFQPDVRRRLPGYRAYAHTAFSEVLPLAIIEALAAGLPVLAGAVGGIPELFDDGVEGRVWPLDDPDAAARAAIDLLADAAALSSTSRAAKRRFEDRFDAALVGPRLVEFLAPSGASGLDARISDDAQALGTTR